jgi:enoyl-CoA hydratase/carnithine racemase
MKNSSLKTNLNNGVATVTIDRPEKRNALNPELLGEIETCFTEIGKMEDVKVVILTGGEKYFSAGFDLNYIRSIDKSDNEEFTALFHRAYRSILFCSQPVIAAVGGPAIAGGFDLTMMCDMRFASEHAKFGQREIAISVTPLIDPLWRIIGLGRALELTLTGRIYDAREAERIGYVNRVYPDGGLLDPVTEIAGNMATFDRDCLMETKRLGYAIVNSGLDEAMKTQEWLFRSYIGSEDNHRRIDSLLESLKK